MTFRTLVTSSPIAAIAAIKQKSSCARIAKFYLLRCRLCAAIDIRLTSTRKIVLKPPQFMVVDTTPRQFFWGEVVSKAFRKSTNTAAVTQPSSMPFLIQSVKYVTASWVEWFFRKPHWKGDSWLDLSKCWRSCICTALSRIFEATGKTEMGR